MLQPCSERRRFNDARRLRGVGSDRSPGEQGGGERGDADRLHGPELERGVAGGGEEAGVDADGEGGDDSAVGLPAFLREFGPGGVEHPDAAIFIAAVEAAAIGMKNQRGVVGAEFADGRGGFCQVCLWKQWKHRESEKACGFP